MRFFGTYGGQHWCRWRTTLSSEGVQRCTGVSVAGVRVVRSPPLGPTKRRASTALNGLLRGTSFRFTLYTLACTEEGTAERARIPASSARLWIFLHGGVWPLLSASLSLHAAAAASTFSLIIIFITCNCVDADNTHRDRDYELIM
jgi:hypothetical protein